MKCIKALFVLAALVILVSPADAGWLRNRRASRWQPQESHVQQVEVVSTDSLPVAREARGAECEDALDEVNALRERHGLRPFLRDALLCRAAHNCARFRAERRMEGHTSDDFNALPEGATARAAGCAAWHGNDWGSCCTLESWTYAGAAWVRGRDGKRYMHLFVR